LMPIQPPALSPGSGDDVLVVPLGPQKKCFDPSE
jgi:hypothetical protein